MDVYLLWVLSSRGLYDELITHPEESYRLLCQLCDQEKSREWGGHSPCWAAAPTKKKKWWYLVDENSGFIKLTLITTYLTAIMALPSWWKSWLSSVDDNMSSQLVTVITTLLVTVMLTSWWHWLYLCDESANCCLPGASLFLPLLSSQRVLSRLYSVVLSLIVPFFLLSASHEGLFILALILNMFCWLLLEQHSADSAKNKVMSQGLLYCMCGVHHLFHIAASFIRERKLQVFGESRDKQSK